MYKKRKKLMIICLIVVPIVLILTFILRKSLYSGQANWTEDMFATSHAWNTDMQNIEYNILSLKKSFYGDIAPSDPNEGQLWYDSTSGSEALKIYDGSSWDSIWDANNNRIADDIVNAESMGDDDYGDFSCLSNTFTLDADVVDSAEIATGAVKTAEIYNGTIAAEDLATDSVTTAKIKTGTAALAGSIGEGARIDIVLQDYCFFPNIHLDGDTMYVAGHTTDDPGNYTARFGLYNTSGSRSYDIDYRYITSSDKPFIYALVDRSISKITHIWTAEDPPPGYWGLSEKPDDFIPPIGVSNPKDYNEICIFNYPITEYKELINQSKLKKKPLHELLNDDYTYNPQTKHFIKK